MRMKLTVALLLGIIIGSMTARTARAVGDGWDIWSIKQVVSLLTDIERNTRR